MSRESSRALWTVGHGRLSRAELGDLLTVAGVELVVDIRRHPGSRTNEAAATGAVPALLAQVGIGYRWDERLGGRRRLTAQEDAASVDPWWQVGQFRAYAAWTRSPDFRAALAILLEDLVGRRTAVMCSESVWWRCHRRLVADIVELEHGVDVRHLMHDGALRPHRLSEGARLAGRSARNGAGAEGGAGGMGAGQGVVWDGGAPALSARPHPG